MTTNIEVSCRCGSVHGRVTDASPAAANHITCYCDDCQAYVHWLSRGDLLDAHGGSDIIQVAPATLHFDRGQEHLRGVRLSAKGLRRFYAHCCATPLGNTLTPAIPFVGLLAQSFVGGAAAAEQVFGPSRGGMFGQFAVGPAPEGSTRINLSLLGSAVRRLLRWRFAGQTWPHPFFDRDTKAPLYPLRTLTATERQALRPHCGPHPERS